MRTYNRKHVSRIARSPKKVEVCGLVWLGILWFEVRFAYEQYHKHSDQGRQVVEKLSEILLSAFYFKRN